MEQDLSKNVWVVASIVNRFRDKRQKRSDPIHPRWSALPLFTVFIIIIKSMLYIPAKGTGVLDIDKVRTQTVPTVDNPVGKGMGT